MLVKIKELTFIYGEGLPWQKKALDNISLSINKGDIYAIMGSTGSGKSTLIQHFNGLLFPTSGTVVVNGIEIKSGVDLKKLRKEVGLVFQFPEQQLFGETVLEDISFGLKKLGLNVLENEERITESLDLVGLEPEKFLNRSPLYLSGGEKRKVALAGVLSMKPSILVLDEPTAGLDPHSRIDIMASLLDYIKKNEATMVIVSNKLDEIANCCNRGLVLHEGFVIFEGSFLDLFQYPDILFRAGLELPFFPRLYHRLKEKDLKLSRIPLTREDFTLGVRKCLASHRLF